MRVYALIVETKGITGPTRYDYATIEEAVNRLAATIHRDGFERATLYGAEFQEIITYTNPRRPPE